MDNTFRGLEAQLTSCNDSKEDRNSSDEDTSKTRQLKRGVLEGNEAQGRESCNVISRTALKNQFQRASTPTLRGPSRKRARVSIVENCETAVTVSDDSSSTLDGLEKGDRNIVASTSNRSKELAKCRFPTPANKKESNTPPAGNGLWESWSKSDQRLGDNGKGNKSFIRINIKYRNESGRSMVMQLSKQVYHDFGDLNNSLSVLIPANCIPLLKASPDIEYAKSDENDGHVEYLSRGSTTSS